MRRTEAAGVPVLLREPSRTKRAGLVVAFDPGPPEGREAFANAVPFRRVGGWTAYIGLPLVGYRQPQGGAGEIGRRQRSDYLLDLLGPALSGAISDLAVVIPDLRKRLDLAPEAPVGLFGASAGGLAVLLALASQPFGLATAAAIFGAAPDAETAVAAAERAFGISYTWTPAARACAKQFNFPSRAVEVARGMPPLLVMRGEDDDAVPAVAIERLRVALRQHYMGAPERLCVATLPGVGHGLDDRGQVATLADKWLSQHLA